MLDSRILEFSDGSKLYSGSCVSSVQGDGNCSKSDLKDFVEYVHGKYDDNPMPDRKCNTTSETVSFIRKHPQNHHPYCYVRQSNVTVKDVVLHWKLTGQCNVFLSDPHNIQDPPFCTRNIRKMKGYGLLVYGKIQTSQISKVHISSGHWRNYGNCVIYVYPIKDFKPFDVSSFRFYDRCLEGRVKAWKWATRTGAMDKSYTRLRLQEDLMDRPEYLLESLSDFYCLGQNEKVFGPGYNKIEWIEH